MNCWDFKKCGRDKSEDCPAFPYQGNICWLVAGTLCEGKVQGTFAQKATSCRECNYFEAINK